LNGVTFFAVDTVTDSPPVDAGPAGVAAGDTAAAWESNAAASPDRTPEPTTTTAKMLSAASSTTANDHREDFSAPRTLTMFRR
jgi:hypothetical protein